MPMSSVAALNSFGPPRSSNGLLRFFRPFSARALAVGGFSLSYGSFELIAGSVVDALVRVFGRLSLALQTSGEADDPDRRATQ